ncbi:hypothetical protein M5K25_026455 [Dendrobium thyrsiflorum]|uniref:Reverse transcriptase zinc-binding domain-containing protein n=1 Tax=Dendrobium thyrsiflorum TaxID=117978 RepID=A0ABD0TXC9_DENTH
MDPTDIFDQALALCELKLFLDLSTSVNRCGRWMDFALNDLMDDFNFEYWDFGIFLEFWNCVASRRLPRLGEISGVWASRHVREKRARSTVAPEVIKPLDNTVPLVDKVLPNLNSPMEESSSSTFDAPIPAETPATGIISPNKFDLLQSQDEPNILDGFTTFSEDPFFSSNHTIFTSEDSCNNFHLSIFGRIWMKWNSSKMSFTPLFISSQMIMGQVTYANNQILHIFVIYASNSEQERLSNLNALIFDSKVMDLQSVGCPFTWFNNRLNNPIHIKLDRALVNEQWLNSFPSSFCSIQAPSCSDHCPIIIKPGEMPISRHRFLFKNYWTRMDSYWYFLLETFSTVPNGNPVIDFCTKLRNLRGLIKTSAWASSNSVQAHLDNLHKLQADCLDKVAVDPLNPTLNANLKSVNTKITESSSYLASWTIQRAKAKWLSQGEVDLKFLYAKIRARNSKKNSFRITPSAPIAFFWDHWSSVDGLADHFHANLDAYVGDFITDNQWALPLDLDPCIANSIKAIPICEDFKTCLLWDNKELGFFGAYVQVFHGDIPRCTWANHLWFKGCALRYSGFGWICMVGGLKTAGALSIKNIYIDLICPLCRTDFESSRHLFFECQYSFNIILKLIPQANTLLLRPNVSQFFDWLDDLHCNADILRLHKLVTCCSIYLIWKERNDRRFGDVMILPYLASLCAAAATPCILSHVLSMGQ